MFLWSSQLKSEGHEKEIMSRTEIPVKHENNILVRF